MKKIDLNGLVKSANYLSLGISIVVAIFLGSFIGYLAYKKSGMQLFLWIGVFIGIAAAFMNIYKIYKISIRNFDDLQNSVKYKNFKPKIGEDED